MNFLTKTISKYIPSLKLSNDSGITPSNSNNSIGPKKGFKYKLQRQRIYVPELRQDALKLAIDIAEDPYNPQRTSLLAIYRETMRDGHLISQTNTAVFKVNSNPWVVVNNKTKEIDLEKTKLFQAQWFEDLNKYILEAEWWGFSLIEFGLMENDPEVGWKFKDLDIIPREHVKPETSEILINPNDTTGIPFNIAPLSDWILPAGNPKNIGTLHIAARHAIYKRFAFSDWSRSSEKWGDPLLVLQSSSDDEEENKRKEEFAANFGNNGYIITDDDDKVTLLERKDKGSHDIFDKFIDKNNDENSKTVNGQTGSADNQAWAGTADAHMEILDEYTKARRRHLMYYHSDRTLPFLIKINKGDSAYAQLKGHTLIPLELLKEIKNPNEQDVLDPNQKPANGGTARKKQMPLP